MLPVFSSLSFSPQPQQPRLLKSRRQKVLGIFIKLLKLAASQRETALKGADAVWEMIEIRHPCAGNSRIHGGGRPAVCGTQSTAGRERGPWSASSSRCGPALIGLQGSHGPSLRSCSGRYYCQLPSSQMKTAAQRGAVTSLRSHSQDVVELECEPRLYHYITFMHTYTCSHSPM